MKIRKHMVLIVGGGTALILIVVALFMLYRFFRTYDRVNEDLDSSMNQLRALQERAPYPSRENVAVTQTNLVILQDYFSNLFAFLREGQIEPVELEAAKFTPLLRDGILRVSKRAQDAGVKLPSLFAMGVERYKMGALPSGADVPRLVLQLKTLEALCDMLIDAKVSEIVSVKRRIFEQGALEPEGAAGGGGRWGSRWGGGGPMPEAAPAEVPAAEAVDPSGLFSTEHYTLEFKCHEKSLWDILDAMAKSKLFGVVTSVSIQNENPLFKLSSTTPAPTAAPAPAAVPAGSAGKGLVAEEIKTQDQRVIAGREFVSVILEVDVYRFLGGEKQEAKP